MFAPSLGGCSSRRRRRTHREASRRVIGCPSTTQPVESFVAQLSPGRPCECTLPGRPRASRGVGRRRRGRRRRRRRAIARHRAPPRAQTRVLLPRARPRRPHRGGPLRVRVQTHRGGDPSEGGGAPSGVSSRVRRGEARRGEAHRRIGCDRSIACRAPSAIPADASEPLSFSSRRPALLVSSVPAAWSTCSACR